MIASARLKIELRVKAMFERWEGYQRDLRDFQVEIDLARTNHTIATALSTRFRQALRNEVPGCEVDLGREHVSIRVPHGYPHSSVPIVVALPSTLRDIAWPAGLAKAEF